MLIHLCWSINPSTSCWSIPVILFDGPVKSALIPQYSNVELLFIALFSLMLTPEAAAALRRPWSSVLLPQRTRALGTQFTILKLENKSRQNGIANIRFHRRHKFQSPPWVSWHLQAAFLRPPRKISPAWSPSPKLEMFLIVAQPQMIKITSLFRLCCRIWTVWSCDLWGSGF